jgi:DNA polymerase-3 subunit delta
MDFKQLLHSIRNKDFKPIYILHGDEPYFIDKISNVIEENALEEHERDFNQTIIYGRDADLVSLISELKGYPMMSERRLVVLREAQEFKQIEQLESYVESPLDTTIFVICYKYKTLDKRKKVTKLFEKSGLVFESKKLYENQVGQWINRVLQAKKYSIEPKASAMLVEFLGTNLEKINNELEKLQIILPVGSTISANDIEENIGFSKDYNIFELRKAIGEKNQLKSYKIAQYFSENHKDHPMLMTTGMLFSFFVQLLQYHGLKDKNPKNVAAVLKVNPFFLKDYDIALRNYPMKKVSKIVTLLRDIDVKSKGVGSNSLPQHELLKEMLVGIFN